MCRLNQSHKVSFFFLSVDNGNLLTRTTLHNMHFQGKGKQRALQSSSRLCFQAILTRRIKNRCCANFAWINHSLLSDFISLNVWFPCFSCPSPLGVWEEEDVVNWAGRQPTFLAPCPEMEMNVLILVVDTPDGVREPWLSRVQMPTRSVFVL